jgi:hypothetical protein
MIMSQTVKTLFRRSFNNAGGCLQTVVIVEYIELGRNGLKVSVIGFGAWQASGKAWGADVEDDQIVKAIIRAHELGVNLIRLKHMAGPF